MKSTTLDRNRLTLLKTMENDLQARIKSKELKPITAFRHPSDADDNEQDIDEMRDTLTHLQRLIESWKDTFELD